MALCANRSRCRTAPRDIGKAWPRFVRINDALPQTATTKILKRDLIRAGETAAGGVLWERRGRGTAYVVVD
jgi:fatty-acyl-CoA synthase